MIRVCYQVFDSVEGFLVVSCFDKATAIKLARALNAEFLVPRFTVDQSIVINGKAVQ